MISVPNLPVSINALLLVSAFCVLVGIGLYPASRVRWFTYLYGGATVVVATSLVVAVLSLQSPLQASEPAAKPIDMFLTSMEQGGANIGLSDPKPTNPPQ